jgi:valyl-tRNA synthetase
MSNKELPKTYNSADYEDEIYQKWEKSGFFNPDNLDLSENAPTYTIILPPPNITDKLHMGHSAMLAIEDLMIRYHRMKGYRTLWLPGTDHAAIATQNAVEKKLLKEQGLTRQRLGKEKFLKEVWKFLQETQAIILRQIRKMGASLDWSREAFTLDEPRKKAVARMFVDMYEAGVIYRGERIVNWCPRCHSTLADDEVEHKEQKAKLYFFKYSKDFPFMLATTRIETKLGDTAVAVNPKDKRYKKYIGKVYKIDFCGIPLKLKIIADREVDMNFGTGALGVTPAHSMIDWQMAQENNLEIKKVINECGKIHKEFNEFSNKTATEAREMIVKKLKKQGLLEKQEEINNNLSVCYRCGTAIEPLPSKQWFVSVDKKIEKLGNKSLKEAAIEVAVSKKIQFIPERFGKRYLDWMENLHDWCISRQIWFGHSIPVYYRKQEISNFQFPISNKIQNSKATLRRACFAFSKIQNSEIYVGVNKPEGDDWTQDSDTLDTWFSSGMWTFSTLGWPASVKISSFVNATEDKLNNFKNKKKIGDLARFHPTQVLETGYEILTLWVSRMIMMSLFALQEIPFERVYLHGMILDKNGKKMSKSKGNGIDPADMIEKFGADAVRLSMLMGSAPGNDSRLSEEKIEGFRNFINKFWNIARYIISNFKCPGLREAENSPKGYMLNVKCQNLTLADKWILNKFNDLIKKVDDDLKDYKFSQVGERLREFTWNDFADWYLEVSKFEKNEEKNKLLFYILENLLKLWHPFIPFVTEVIWSSFVKITEDKPSFANVMKDKQEFLMTEKWPIDLKGKSICVDADNFEIIKNIIIAIRNVRAENKIELNKKIKVIICAKKYVDLIEENKELIKNLKTNISELEIESIGPIFSSLARNNKQVCSSLDRSKIKKSCDFIEARDDKMIRVIVDDDVEIYLIGVKDEEKERAKINKKIAELEKLILNIKKKLSNKEFINKAPKQIIEKEKEKLKARELELKKIKRVIMGIQ